MKRAFVMATVFLLAACGAGPPRSVTPMENSNTLDRHRSWIDPSARTHALLYVSDAEPGAGTVYVFTYPRLKLAGVLTGFGQPLGECADAAGDVWIADYSNEQIVEYAHGASSPTSTLDDANRRPYSCAVDPKSGDLAVADIFGPSDGPGGLSIYKVAKGRAHFYSGRSVYKAYFDAYDGNGNVYVDGLSQLYYGKFAIARFDGKRFTPIALNHAIADPGGLAVLGSQLNVGDQAYGANVVYQFAVNGSKGTLVGTTPLTGATDIRQYAISGNSLVAGNGAYQSASGMVFDYPAGGSPKKTFGADTFKVPFGAVISKLR